MDSDLISRKALLEKTWDADTRCGYVQVVDVHEIENAPTVDTVEVVRCKDCKFCDPESGHCDHYMGTVTPLSRKAYDFCSYGAKMDGGDE